MPPGLTVLQWVTDFGQRIEQMQKVSTAASKDTKALKVRNNYISTNLFKGGPSFLLLSSLGYPCMAWWTLLTRSICNCLQAVCSSAKSLVAGRVTPGGKLS